MGFGAVSFSNVWTGFPGGNTATNGTEVSGTTTFLDDVSGESGVVRMSYVSTYESNGYTTTGSFAGGGSNFFPNNGGTGRFVAQNGTWTIEFFTDATLSTPTSIANFTLGLTHFNDASQGWSEDYFHLFKVNGTETLASNFDGSGTNHIYDPSLNAIGNQTSGGQSFTTTSELTFAGPVQTLTFEAGQTDTSGQSLAIPATPDSPAGVGNGFRNSLNGDYVTIGVDTNSFGGSGVQAIPEPASGLLLALGSLGLIRRRRV